MAAGMGPGPTALEQWQAVSGRVNTGFSVTIVIAFKFILFQWTGYWTPWLVPVGPGTSRPGRPLYDVFAPKRAQSSGTYLMNT